MFCEERLGIRIGEPYTQVGWRAPQRLNAHSDGQETAPCQCRAHNYAGGKKKLSHRLTGRTGEIWREIVSECFIHPL